MKTLLTHSIRLGLFLSIAATASFSSAQDPVQAKSVDDMINEIELFGTRERPVASGSSASDYQKKSVQELRQERAIYRAEQRMLRRERQLWMGYEPLRPQFNAMPQTSSRYGRPTIYVPVYIR
ncbi:hypothetical protein Pla22_29120 [Rubripirellula amarantea]|uniref:Uncharacterized protein n=1 Tax=Rubripirellula amarantea TaxID=2527999 RepID=A0A5C5WJY8_9BACT|nr:hypothetical protein [Rubripirellula amarantea]TWT50172.1 hypothetical protein Pla22_29120 [Rubripirellula amarantea]